MSEEYQQGIVPIRSQGFNSTNLCLTKPYIGFRGEPFKVNPKNRKWKDVDRFRTGVLLYPEKAKNEMILNVFEPD